MAIPSRRNLMKSRKSREHWADVNKPEKEDKKEITPEEHEERVKMLREMGLLK